LKSDLKSPYSPYSKTFKNLPELKRWIQEEWEKRGREAKRVSKEKEGNEKKRIVEETEEGDGGSGKGKGKDKKQKV